MLSKQHETFRGFSHFNVSKTNYETDVRDLCRKTPAAFDPAVFPSPTLTSRAACRLGVISILAGFYRIAHSTISAD